MTPCHRQYELDVPEDCILKSKDGHFKLHYKTKNYQEAAENIEMLPFPIKDIGSLFST